jgi:hypothetical protein
VDDRGSSRGGLPGDQDRLARVERQLAELQAEVAQLKRILSRSGDEPDDEPGDDLLKAAGSSRSDASAGGVGRPTHAQVVLTIFAAAPPVYSRSVQILAAELVGASAKPPQVKAVVYVHAPPELHDWAREQPAPAPLREHAELVIKGVQERLTDGLAGLFVNAVWQPATADWRVADFGGFDRVSGLPDDLDNWGHREIGTWAARLGLVAGLPGSAADGIGAVVGYLVPLPADRHLEDLSRVIRVAGIVTFAAHVHVPAAGGPARARYPVHLLRRSK